MAKKKLSRNLVPVGTHITPNTKLGLQALADSQDTTVYAVIQQLIEEAVKEYISQINSLKGEKLETSDGSDLLE